MVPSARCQGTLAIVSKNIEVAGADSVGLAKFTCEIGGRRKALTFIEF